MTRDIPSVAFYHLTASSAAKVLPQLVAKTLAAGKHGLICADKSQIQPLSAALWSHDADSWLPHGVAGKDDEKAVLCPIWFAENTKENPNAASFFFLLDGIALGDNTDAERVFILFNGGDEGVVANARTQWKDMRAHGHDLSYWTEDPLGKWTQTA